MLPGSGADELAAKWRFSASLLDRWWLPGYDPEHVVLIEGDIPLKIAGAVALHIGDHAL